MAENGVIGRDNQLPWVLPEDLRRFKAITLGKPILMGRRTFESIGRPLPGRSSLVLTRSSSFQAAGTQIVHSLEEALDAASASAELVVIGGAEVYRAALPLARRIYLTRVQAQVAGDTRFPELPAGWRHLDRSVWPADARHAYPLTFETLERP